MDLKSIKERFDKDWPPSHREVAWLLELAEEAFVARDQREIKQAKKREKKAWADGFSAGLKKAEEAVALGQKVAKAIRSRGRK